MRFGIHKPLEDEANRLLKESIKGVTKYSDKSDFLTVWKEKDRANRELALNPSGFPEATVRQGMFHRKINPNRPDLNSRNGISQASNRGFNLVQTHMQEYGNKPEG